MIPKTGDRANIPAMWRLMVSPTIVSVAPWCNRWTGVIAMIATITTCGPTVASIA